jgi:hypothetical protein
MFRRRAVLIPLSLGIVAVGPVVPAATPTTTHNPRTVPTVLALDIANPVFNGEPNTMMFTLTARVDDTLNNALHDATVGYVPSSEYVACDRTTDWKYSSDVQRFTAEHETLTWTLYNFVPGTAYHYVVRTGYGGNYRYSCGALPTPTLPTAVGALNFQYETAGPLHPFYTRYVLLNMDDCGASGGSSAGSHAQFVVLDPNEQSVVWYLDMAHMTGLEDPTVTGWRYQRATMDTPARLLVLIDKRYLYDWTFDGTLRGFYDFGTTCEGDSTGPCVHHDAIQSEETGNTYVIATKESGMDPTGTLWEACGTDSNFINDGFQVLDSSYAKLDELYLMTDYGYDPLVEPGPLSRTITEESDVCAASTWVNYLTNDVIDWTHANSLDLSVVGGVEVLDFSLHGWDQVIRVNADDGSYITSIAGNPEHSDLGSLRMATGIGGDATFSAQHDVHSVGYDTMMMLDNLGDRVGSRVLRISNISTDPTIDRNWVLLDATGKPMECPVEGSAQEVPGTGGDNVLSVCQDEYAVVELDDYDGYSPKSTNHPPLVITLPDGTTDDFCTVDGPSNRRFLRGLYRAYPLAALGSFD